MDQKQEAKELERLLRVFRPGDVDDSVAVMHAVRVPIGVHAVFC